MARMRVRRQLLEDLVFGFTANPVSIAGVVFDDVTGEAIFEISGPDVPDTAEVMGVMQIQHNRAHQHLVTVTFVALDAPALN